MATHDETPGRDNVLLSCSAVAGRLSERAAQLLAAGRSAASRARVRLHMESLEPRLLPAATPLAELVSPGWFQEVSGPSVPLHAAAAGWSASSTGQQTPAAGADSNGYDWIVRFNGAAADQVSSVGETASLLVGSGVEFQVLRGLGLTGQVLVRSTGASAEMVRSVLASNAAVAEFERDAVQQFQAVPNDPQLGLLWGLENAGQCGGLADADIDAAAAWGISAGSRNVVVAVVDTGVDWHHPDLAANIWTSSGEIAGNGIDDDRDGFVDDVHGYNFAGNSGDPMDDNGHGTHVAGTIAAVGNNGVGVAGIDWAGSIMPLKFLGADGSGHTSDAVRAINYATLQRTQYGVNVRAINMSWGGGAYSGSLQSAIQAAGNAGILCVAAAGNRSKNNDANPQYPSNYDAANLLAVAATDGNDRLASFSNYGATTVDLAAPGVSILSTYPNNRYVSLSGTSMATPHVTGVAALAWSVAPSATVAEIKNAVLGGVDRIAGLSGKVATGGRLNAYNTLRQLAVVAQDDYGNDAASAARVAVGSTMGGRIEKGDDRDWFTFRATAGQRYSFYTELTTLEDSVLTLYGPDATALAYNDDAPGRGFASEIKWIAPAGGSYYLEVKAYSGLQTGAYALALRSDANTPPTLAALGDRTMSVLQDSIAVSLTATDVEGDRLAFTAVVVPSSTLPGLAYELDQRLGLYSTGNYLQNLRGCREKWMRGDGGKSYYILPNGELHQWTGSVRSSPLVATLSRDYWARPRLLHDAPPAPGIIPADAVSLSLRGSVLTINPRDGLLGQFQVQVTVSDGVYTDTETFKVTVTNTGSGSRAARGLSFGSGATGGLSTSAFVSRASELPVALGGAVGRAGLIRAIDQFLGWPGRGQPSGAAVGQAAGAGSESAAWQTTRLESSAAATGLLDRLASVPQTAGGPESPRSQTGIPRSNMLAEILDEHRANTENRLELVAEILDEFSSLLSQNSRPVPEAVAG